MFAGGLGGREGITIRHQRLASDNLLCLVSELYYGHRDYVSLHDAMVSTRDVKRKKELKGDLEKRDDGPHPDFVPLTAYFGYAMAVFTILPSSGGR